MTRDRHRETTVEERFAVSAQDECLREPVPKRGTIFASSDGAIAIDNAGIEADPAPVTTIA